MRGLIEFRDMIRAESYQLFDERIEEILYIHALLKSAERIEHGDVVMRLKSVRSPTRIQVSDAEHIFEVWITPHVNPENISLHYYPDGMERTLLAATRNKYAGLDVEELVALLNCIDFVYHIVCPGVVKNE